MTAQKRYKPLEQRIASMHRSLFNYTAIGVSVVLSGVDR